MIRLPRRPRAANADAGSALVLALVFLSLFGIFIAVLLSFTAVSFRTTLAVRDQAASAFAADGAVEAAINNIRTNPGIDVTTSCPATALTLNGVQADVACQGVVAGGGGSANPNNTPPYTILTLSSGGEDGILQGSQLAFNVDGDVYSNSTINVESANGEMNVIGDVTAHAPAGCNGTINATGTRNCDDPDNVPDPGAGNPKYAPLVATAPAAQTVPGCSPVGTNVTFDPGTYADATALSSLINGCNRTFHFTPGTYYFNFASADPVWTITNANARIIGGTLNAAGTDCVDQATNGVQFIFGGASRLDVNGPDVFLCAHGWADKQQIAVYGPATGSTTGAATFTGTSATSTTFASPDKATVRDGDSASVQLDSDSATATPPGTASIALSPYGGGSIPAGSTITSAKLKTRQMATVANSSHLNQLSLALSATTTGGAAILTGAGVTKCTSLCEQEFDVTSSLDTPTKIADLAVTFTASMSSPPTNKTAIESLDAVWLEVTYQTPGLNPQSGCVTATLNAGGCPFIRTDGNNTEFHIRGTVYAPGAFLHIALPNQTEQVFERGVILRALKVQLPASSTPGASHFRRPSTFGSPTAKTVLFTATVGGQVRLRALVEFDLTAGSAPTVKSWSVVR